MVVSDLHLHIGHLTLLMICRNVQISRTQTFAVTRPLLWKQKVRLTRMDGEGSDILVSFSALPAQLERQYQEVVKSLRHRRLKVCS